MHKELCKDMFHKIKNFIKKIVFATKKLLKRVSVIVAHRLIIAGYMLLGDYNRYQVIVNTIEDLFTSIDLYIKVIKVQDNPIFVRFIVEIASSSERLIDWKYFILELVYQLGCALSDVVIDEDLTSNKKYRKFSIDITKTAITNLEKGITSVEPLLFSEQNTGLIMIKALELIQHEEKMTPELLAKRLNINVFRADKLYNQLQKKGLVEKSTHKIIVN